MFAFAVNNSIDSYARYWGIESDVRGGRGHKIFCLHVVGPVQYIIIYWSRLILEKTSLDPTEQQQSQC